MRTAILALLVIAALGCKKERAGDEKRVATFSKKAADRGRKVCATFVERVCACESEGREVPEPCELAKGRTEALKLALRAVSAARDRDAKDRWALDQNARQIIQKCVKADLELDPQTCPRPAKAGK